MTPLRLVDQQGHRRASLRDQLFPNVICLLGTGDYHGGMARITSLRK